MKKFREEDRCTATVDIEDFIAMKDLDECTHIKAIVTYKSGRVEEFKCKLRVDGTPTLKFSKKVSDLKQYFAVETVKVEKFKE